MKRLGVKSSVIAGALGLGVALAQRSYDESYIPNEDSVRTAREVPWHSTPPPVWTNDSQFARDVFTFVRIRRQDNPNASFRAGRWTTDCPDSDLNLSYRVQQMSSIKVDPDGRILNLTDPELVSFPWIYMVEPGSLILCEDEAIALRKYLLNGGFFMADDFWGPHQWATFRDEIKKVFPDREFEELSWDHPIFHCVFDLKGSKNALQVPNMWTGARSRWTGVTWENHDGFVCREVHVRAIFDDRRRIMIIACHNTDNGDGWEREGENDYFFHNFSEKIAFPLGINILFYAMTH